MPNPFESAALSLSVSSAPRRQAFQGAVSNRLNRDWYASNTSPDYEARGVRRILRARARQLVKDNPYAAGFITEVQNNVIGPYGIRLRAQIKVGDISHKKTNDAIEAAWADWQLPENASVDGIDGFRDIERLVAATVFVDGDCFLRRHKYFRNDHGYALQFIDADQVDDDYNVLPGDGKNEIRGGIEFDSYGRPLFYHVWDRHPSDVAKRTRIPIPADEIKHFFFRWRPNATRGVTAFAPVLMSLKMHDGYTEAELVAARTAAAKMGFLVNKNPEMGAGGFEDDDSTDEDVKDRMMEAAPGILEELDPGLELQMFDPQHPTAGFGEFTKVILRGIARGLGTSYLTLTGDLTGANYSSMRAGMLPERDHWRAIQEWLSVRLHRSVYRDWVPMALLTGALKVDSRIASDYSAVAWKPRGWRSVDPLKDIQGHVLAIQHGMDSRTDAVDEEGGDIEEVFENLSNENELADEYGIQINPAAPPVANQPMGQVGEADKEDAGDGESDTTTTEKPSGRALRRIS